MNTSSSVRTDEVRGNDSDGRSRARFNAKLLALLTFGCYVGFIVVAAVKSFIGG
jgi:hypothetical protein